MGLSLPAAPRVPPDPKALIDWHQPPASTAECLLRIEVLAERLQNHLRFIHDIDSLAGASGEMKHKAAASFYDRLLHLDRSLARLGDDLRLS